MGQEEFENLRTLTYPDTDLFMVCFSLINRTSFDNVKNVWLNDLNGRAAKVPKFLVGTMKDLKDQKGGSIKRSAGTTAKNSDAPITKGEIDKVVKDNKLTGFMEVSAKEDVP